MYKNCSVVILWVRWCKNRETHWGLRELLFLLPFRINLWPLRNYLVKSQKHKNFHQPSKKILNPWHVSWTWWWIIRNVTACSLRKIALISVKTHFCHMNSHATNYYLHACCFPHPDKICLALMKIPKILFRTP